METAAQASIQQQHCAEHIHPPYSNVLTPPEELLQSSSSSSSFACGQSQLLEHALLPSQDMNPGFTDSSLSSSFTSATTATATVVATSSSSSSSDSTNTDFSIAFSMIESAEAVAHTGNNANAAASSSSSLHLNGSHALVFDTSDVVLPADAPIESFPEFDNVYEQQHFEQKPSEQTYDAHAFWDSSPLPPSSNPSMQSTEPLLAGEFNHLGGAAVTTTGFTPAEDTAAAANNDHLLSSDASMEGLATRTTEQAAAPEPMSLWNGKEGANNAPSPFASSATTASSTAHAPSGLLAPPGAAAHGTSLLQLQQYHSPMPSAPSSATSSPMPATRPAVRASSMLNPATAAAATATAASSARPTSVSSSQSIQSSSSAPAPSALASDPNHPLPAGFRRRAASSAPEHPPAASVPPTASAPVPAPAHAPAATAPPSGSHSHHQRPRPPTDLKPYEPKHRPFPFCRSLAEFDKGNKVGDGQFGEVFRAYDKLHNNRPVALKSVKMQEEQEGFPITSVREIKILRWQSSHENIVRLYDLVREESRDKRPETFYLCFEFMDCDLEALIKTPTVVLSSGIIKCYVKQIMTGLNHMHLNNVVHRDLKAANILINNRGQLKLGDFGLARVLLEKKNKDMEGGYTNRVVTLWYRCPELLLGDTAYNTAIDMWSVGCIVYEMYTRSTLFREESEMAMLRKIIELCGSPAGESWPDVEKLPNFKDVSGLNCKRRVREALNSKIQDLEAVNLIDCLLTLNPAKRYSATQCLDHDYFWKSPLPLKPEELPKIPVSHEFAIRQKREKERQQAQMHRGATHAPGHPGQTHGHPGQPHHGHPAHPQHGRHPPPHAAAPGHASVPALKPATASYGSAAPHSAHRPATASYGTSGQTVRPLNPVPNGTVVPPLRPAQASGPSTHHGGPTSSSHPPPHHRPSGPPPPLAGQPNRSTSQYSTTALLHGRAASNATQSPSAAPGARAPYGTPPGAGAAGAVPRPYSSSPIVAPQKRPHESSGAGLMPNPPSVAHAQPGAPGAPHAADAKRPRLEPAASQGPPRPR